MKILDVEIDFNILDAEQVAKFEDELEKVSEKCKNNKNKKMKLSEAIISECNIIEEFFDNVFEEGISKKIFKGKKALDEHIEAFKNIVDEKIRNQSKLEQSLAEINQKYSPNRATRRVKK